MIDKKIWGGLKKKLSNISLGIAGRRFIIVDIPSGSDDLAFTAKGNKIYINPNHDMLSSLNQTDSIMFVEGLFAHELMHQLATDFPYFELMLDKLSKREGKIFAMIFNVIEDPAIEYLAPKYFGGHLLRALSFTIMSCYKNSFDFSSMHSFSQFVNALIHYGDGGLLKSEFTSEEAKEYFIKSLPIIDRAIEETNGRKRIELAYEVFELTRPLWDDPAATNEEQDEMLDELNESMTASGKGTSGTSDGPASSGNNSGGGQQPSSANQKKRERRKLTVQRITEEEAKEMGIDISALPESDGSDLNDGDTIIVVEGDGSNPPSNNGIEIPMSGVEQSKKSSSSDEEGEGLDAESKSDEDSKNPSDSQNDEPYDRVGEKLDSKTEGTGEIEESEYTVSSEDVAIIEASLDECERLFGIAEREAVEIDSEPLDVPQMEVYYNGVSCNNIRVNVSEEDCLRPLYETCLSKMNGSINFAVNQLKRIFRNDIEEKERRATGKINVRRLSEGKMTTHVFDKRRNPSHKSDIAVMFLFDESGSMNGHKTACARLCAIGMAEVFGKLNIPISIIGFTGDTMNYDVEHYHYISWKNTPTKRLGLLNIQARDCNFDGYSIRYATELLKKRPEQHKLLIIGSDGRPNSDYYGSGVIGIKDTGDAIRQASKVADVIGVAIGTSDTDVLYSMYKNDFLLVSKPEELYSQLVNRIKNKVKKWD